jgi:hypothetical protein
MGADDLAWGSRFEDVIMQFIGSVLAGIARLTRHYRVTCTVSWLPHRRRPGVVGDNTLPRARRFLTLDITIEATGEIRSLGLHLMPRPSFSHGARI